MLAQRCVSLLCDPQQRCGIDRLLVVTFTRAAAAELRVRIAGELRTAAARSMDPQLRRHLRQQELRVEAADIGTIDAWCQRIVREHFAEAGVDLRFTVLSDEDARVLRGTVLDELFTAIHRGSDAWTAAARAWIARAPQPDDAFLRELVLGLSRFREHLVNPEAWFARERARAAAGAADAEHAVADAADVLAQALGEECAFQRTQLERLLAAQTAAARAALEPYAAALATWQAGLARPNAAGGVGPAEVARIAAEISAFQIPKPDRHRRPTLVEAPLVAEVRARWLGERLQKPWAAERVAALLAQAPQIAALAGTLLSLEDRYHALLAEAKRRRAVYEFGDVLRLALDLLGTPTAVDSAAEHVATERAPTDIAYRLQQRYLHILVDEYQDTSPVQAEILRLVTRGGAPQAGAVSSEPADSNRFMVGDVKQSIYGFREAEPRLFTDFIAACAAGRAAGQVEYLSDNFRSHAELLGGLNALFERLFDRALGGMEYGERERLQAGRAAGEIENPSLAGPRVAVHFLEHERGRKPPAPRSNGSGAHGGAAMRSNGLTDPYAADGVPLTADTDALEPELIEREALLALREIRALLAAGTQIPDRAADGTVQLRPLRLADIVILLRSAVKNAAAVARVLRAGGIACVTSGRETLLDALEVRDICNVLELLVNRRHDVALAAYLRGPFNGLSESDLLAIVRTPDPPAPDFYSAVEAYQRLRPVESLAARLDAALNQLDRWAVAAREEELPALLRRIFHDSGVVLLAAALKDGAQRVTLLHALQNFAAAFATGPAAAADQFVEYLQSLADEEVAPGALAATEADVVRIMTIHGAKGLEFPVVFLLGCGAQFNRRGQHGALQCDEELGLGLRFADYPARATLCAARHHLLARRRAQRELEEELRLLYVAATRAREKLYLFGHAAPEAWAQARDAYAPASHPGRPPAEEVVCSAAPPLISRLCVHNRLEWVLMAAAASGAFVEPDTPTPTTPSRALLTIATHPEDDAAVFPSDTPPAGGAPVMLDAADAAWVDRALALISADVASVHADYPALMSVSALKEQAARHADADRPHALDGALQPLAAPFFADATAPPDGRAVGTACHKFLELADFVRLGRPIEVQLQANELVAAGRLSAADAACVPVADIAWFAGTAEGKLLARAGAAIRREVPFVYALELGGTGARTIVRGVIDCLVETPAGLVLIDYKTDAVQDETALQARLAGYQVQLQIYAQAAGAIFHRPVARAVLAFLRARRVIDVPPIFDAAAGPQRPEGWLSA